MHYSSSVVRGNLGNGECATYFVLASLCALPSDRILNASMVGDDHNEIE